MNFRFSNAGDTVKMRYPFCCVSMICKAIDSFKKLKCVQNIILTAEVNNVILFIRNVEIVPNIMER